MTEQQQQQLSAPCADESMPLTYASLLRTDVHPMLRPHIERLAGEQADAASAAGNTAEASNLLGKIGVAEAQPVPQLLDMAISEVATLLSQVESQGLASGAKPLFLKDITARLRAITLFKDERQVRDAMSGNSQFQQLRIQNGRYIQNVTNRALHERILKYLEDTGLPTTEEDNAHINAFFEADDREQKFKVLHSFATHGLLTLSSAMHKGLVQETSSTPGDYASIENMLDEDGASSVRGYVVEQNSGDDVFYGRNSFFQVVMERGGEAIDRAMWLPKDEVENRMQNSILFVAKIENLPLSVRSDNQHDEDIVPQDIPPESINFALVNKENYAVTREAFADLPVHIVPVGSAMAAFEGFADNPYRVPDYKAALRRLSATQGPLWCHISRLPVDTYPSQSS